jgi:hypothetical protein
MSLSNTFVQQTDAVAGSVIGALSGAVVAATAPPSEAPWWASWIAAALAGALPVILIRVFSAVAAGRESLARSKRARAAELLADHDAANDREAQRLLDEAAKHEAEAAALRALRGAPPPPKE